MQQQAPGNQPTPAQVFQETQRLIRVGDIYGAAQRAGKLRAHFPDDIPILALHGFVLAYLGVHAQALSDLVRAAQMTEDALKNDEDENPARPRIIDQLIRLSVQICRSSMAIGEEAAAKEAIETALQWDPDRGDAVAAKAEMLAQLGQTDEASKLIEQGFKEKLDTMPLVLAKARVLLGDESASSDALKEVIPELEEHAGIAGMPAIELGEMLRALGQIHDRLGDHNESFNAFRRAARLRRGNYDPRTYTLMTTKVITDWSLENLSKVMQPELSGESQAFMLGSPQSGVQELAAMLGQIEGLTNVGPLETMASTCIQYLGASKGVLRPVPFEPQKLRRNQLEDAGKAYMMQVRALTGEPFSTFLDTHPLNIPHAGAAAMMLPGAHIIMCRRDPIESTLACYCDAMPGNHPYAGDLLNVAGFVADSNRMLDHWSQVLTDEAVGANFIEVNYADLVSDPVGTALKVAEQMGIQADVSAITQVPTFASGPASHADDFSNYTKQARDLLEPAAAE